MPKHFRKDNPNGITPPNPDVIVTYFDHITKRRGMKTCYTSVSEGEKFINHFDGCLYHTSASSIKIDGHEFIPHSNVIANLCQARATTDRHERIAIDRAILMASRAQEALIRWDLKNKNVQRKNRISQAQNQIQ